MVTVLYDLLQSTYERLSAHGSQVAAGLRQTAPSYQRVSTLSDRVDDPGWQANYLRLPPVQMLKLRWIETVLVGLRRGPHACSNPQSPTGDLTARGPLGDCVLKESVGGEAEFGRSVLSVLALHGPQSFKQGSYEESPRISLSQEITAILDLRSKRSEMPQYLSRLTPVDAANHEAVIDEHPPLFFRQVAQYEQQGYEYRMCDVLHRAMYLNRVTIVHHAAPATNGERAWMTLLQNPNALRRLRETLAHLMVSHQNVAVVGLQRGGMQPLLAHYYCLHRAIVLQSEPMRQEQLLDQIDRYVAAVNSRGREQAITNFAAYQLLVKTLLGDLVNAHLLIHPYDP